MYEKYQKKSLFVIVTNGMIAIKKHTFIVFNSTIFKDSFVLLQVY